MTEFGHAPAAARPADSWADRRRRFFDSFPPLLLISLAWLAVIVIVALFADLLTPHDFTKTNLRSRLAPPDFFAGDYFFGTDNLGRDVFSRLLVSIRVSMLVALFGTAIGAVIGTTLGFVAAHFRGWVDDVIMGLVDFQASMPFLVFALAVLAFFGNSLVLFIVVIGFQGWERYARICRGLALSAITHGYAVAVRTLGAPPVWVYGRHILPNIASALIVNMTLNFPDTILLEAGVSFLGLGIQPPLSSLGNMLSLGRQYLLNSWWIAVLPGVTIFLTTLAMSIVGDWLRDRLDPTLR